MTTRGWWPPLNGSDYFVSIARPGTGESQERETRRPSRGQAAQGRNENEMNLDERLEALTMSLELMLRETGAAQQAN
jgi:hypothetical protein